MYDLIVKNGWIYDGTGNPWFKANIAVDAGRIIEVGKLDNYNEVEKTIDATGLFVCPGFIDVHTHSEITLLINGRAESAVRQGITLQVTGNCGMSAAPITEERRDFLLDFNLRGYRDEVEVDWLSFDEYLDKLEKSGVAINVASLVGQGTIRMCVMGYAERKPQYDELVRMKNLVVDAMKDGAFGMSVGLTLIPSCFAGTDELVELCEVVKEYDGVYMTHQGGKRKDKARVGGTYETIEIGDKTGVTVHPVHHIFFFFSPTGVPVIYEFQGKVEDYLKIIDDARLKGIKITCDLYPYNWASAGLSGILPPWVLEGGIEKAIERIKNPETRYKIKRDMISNEYADTNLGFITRNEAWDEVILLQHSKVKDYIGKTLTEIAALMDEEPLESVLDIFITEDDEPSGLRTIQKVITDDILSILIKHPSYMIGSDGEALAPYGVLGKKLHHPRCYGSYPKVLGRWVRDKKFISMEEAVRKMTSFPAQIFGIQDRGIIKKGMWADITIFDPETVIDMATYQDPHQYPEGIKHVIVNGRLVIENEEHTGVLSGKVLRGPGYTRGLH